MTRTHQNAASIEAVPAWYSEDHLWPDRAHTVEWFVDVLFPEDAAWATFQRRWRHRLKGEMEPQDQNSDS